MAAAYDKESPCFKYQDVRYPWEARDDLEVECSTIINMAADTGQQRRWWPIGLEVADVDDSYGLDKANASVVQAAFISGMFVFLAAVMDNSL